MVRDQKAFLDMGPRLQLTDSHHLRSTDPEADRDVCRRGRGRTNFSNALTIQFCISILLSVSGADIALASFRNHVGDVLGIRSQPEVIWIHASPYVATMQNVKTIWNWTPTECPRHSMSGHNGSCSDPKLTVTARHDRSSPQPAASGIAPVHFSPEPCSAICAISKHRTTVSRAGSLFGILRRDLEGRIADRALFGNLQSNHADPLMVKWQESVADSQSASGSSILPDFRLEL